ncbi:MAG: diguanylate cyclase [Gammaproteobacteria bacterium]|nr:diguanylate cyclase [Gammaproteobacteria bacterium]
MRLQRKISYFFLLSSIIMVTLIVIVGLSSFRYFSMSTAKSNALIMAESVRVGLTELMINGQIDKRKSYLERLTQINGLLSTRVTRSDDVRKQYKEGFESEKIEDDIDRQVLTTGKAVFVVEDERVNPILRSTIPFVATKIGTPNCLNCHQVKEGTVLGTITIRTDIAELRNGAIATISVIAGFMGIFAILAFIFFRRLLKPLLITANDLQKSVEQAKGGRFDIEIQQRSNDEIGQIAVDFNALLGYLNVGLSHIKKSVSELINCKFNDSSDSLASTINMIEGLAKASKFKQSIEEDENKEEVYVRLGRVLKEQFTVDDFSIYEIYSSPKKQILPVMVDGETNADCRWCDPQILVRPSACRAKRTGRMISNLETPNICNFFVGSEDKTYYTCVPIIQSGSVGSVIQLVSDHRSAERIQSLIPYLQPYLREAAPVIETKRLMSTLKESNLRDAMTGLNNRRFLEEYVETMVANIERQKSSISILMLDLDYFKQVNDKYGHDVGDKVLVELSKVLVKSVRSSDLVIRYGGEEFVIILQNTQKGYAEQVAEKIRSAVEEMQVQTQGVVIKKTISIGMADFPEDSDTFWQTLKFADVALYKAKDSGRNQSIHFHPDMWEGSEGY